MPIKQVYAYYENRVKSCDPDDLWRQVDRTVSGKVVAEEQIAMIETAILEGLRLAKEDRLLDICCGNGALTDRLFRNCAGGLGIDLSDSMIAVARRYFERAPTRLFGVADATEWVAGFSSESNFSKAVCYGSFMYFPPERAGEFLTQLRQRFSSITRFFVGNLLNKSKIHDFLGPERYVPGIEDDHAPPFGIWRTEAEFAALAGMAGWTVEFRRMPAEFYGSSYRYDAILTPARPQ